jgi:hypothetical protein
MRYNAERITHHGYFMWRTITSRIRGISQPCCSGVLRYTKGVKKPATLKSPALKDFQ